MNFAGTDVPTGYADRMGLALPVVRMTVSAHGVETRNDTAIADRVALVNADHTSDHRLKGEDVAVITNTNPVTVILGRGRPAEKGNGMVAGRQIPPLQDRPTTPASQENRVTSRASDGNGPLSRVFRESRVTGEAGSPDGQRFRKLNQGVMKWLD